MKITFVSNYINHHQIPFCEAMCRQPGVEYTFIQTEPMEEERIGIGWEQREDLPYLKIFYREPELCGKLILDSDVVLFGGCEDESYISERLERGGPVFRYSERLYREGQWKAVSPRGLKKKYRDHVRYRRSPVYLLCAGAYTADDFHIIRAYPGKMFRWGYFPETYTYDLDRLMERKGSGEDRRISICWAGRMIALKHPELAVQTAAYLKRRGIDFQMTFAGGGPMEETLRDMAKKLDVEREIRFAGVCTPGQVRKLMEGADIFLFTSDRREGWGAVANEAMNSACAVVADHLIGAVPYLIRNGENGLIYRDKDSRQLFELTAWLAQDRSRCRKLGEQAYRTVTEEWNPENAAACLMELMGRLGLDTRQASETPSGGGDAGNKGRSARGSARGDARRNACGNAGVCTDQSARGDARRITGTGPCSPAPVVAERKMYRVLEKRGL